MFNKIIEQRAPNSFDVLKTLATFTLILDHYGFFFAGNTEIFRVIGRLGYLLFIFCYGYNQKFHFDSKIISLAILMVFNQYIMYPEQFALSNIFHYSILFSVIIAQIFMFFIAKKLKEENIFSWLILLELLALPTRLLFPFGTEGIIICICGYICANFKQGNTHPILLAIGLTFYAVIESIDHGFSLFSMGILSVIFIGLWFTLSKFDTYPVKVPSSIILFISKYSLLIFFIHYEIFALIHWYNSNHL